MPISLSFSHQTELLADCLIERMQAERQAANSLLYRPVVIVPSINVQRWLQLRLVEQHGIAAPIHFLHLEQGLVHLSAKYGASTNHGQGASEAAAIPPDPSGGSALALALLYELLPLTIQQLSSNTSLLPFAPLVTTGGSPEEQARRLWGTCQSLAQLLREYAFHRLPMLLAWLRGETWLLSRCGAHWHTQERWQRELFLRVMGAVGGEQPTTAPTDHALALVATARRWQAEDSTRANRSASDLLPQQVHIFGFSLISTLHRLWIERLGRHTTMHLYQINACAEFWEDMESSSEVLHRRARSIAIEEDLDGEYLAPSAFENSLLQSFGKAGREATKLFSDLADISLERLEEPSTDSTSLLRALQRQIVCRTNVAERLPCDDSLRMMRYESPTAEVEAVHAEIVRALAADPTLMLGQIAVFAPDFGTYAPLFRLLFGSLEPHLPFALLDARVDDASSFAHFIKLFLRLASGEITRETIVTLIGNSCAQTAAHLSERFNVGEFRELLSELGFYEGSGFDEHACGEVIPRSLAQALARNRLGRIMATPVGLDTTDAALDEHDDVHGLVPYSSLFSRSDDTATASLYIESLLAYVKGAKILQQTLGSWLAWLRIGVDLFGMPTDKAPREQSVARDLFERLAALAAVPNIQTANESGGLALSLPLFSEIIFGTFGEQRAGYGSFLQGGLVIGSLRPLRPIPFRRIFVIGLGEATFPGSAQRNSLDLRQAYRLIGDVSSSELNAYLFLETLLSARDALWLSYVDRDAERDLPLAPSAVLTELQVHLTTTLLLPGEALNPEQSRPREAHPTRLSSPNSNPTLLPAPWLDLPGISLPKTLRISMLHKFLQNPLSVGLATIARASSRLEEPDSATVPLYEDGARRSEIAMRGLQAGLADPNNPSAINAALDKAYSYFARRSLAPPTAFIQRDIIDQQVLISKACGEILSLLPPSDWTFCTGYALGSPYGGQNHLVSAPPLRTLGNKTLEDLIPPHFMHRRSGEIALLYATWKSAESTRRPTIAAPNRAAIDAFLLQVLLLSATIEEPSPLLPFVNGLASGTTTVLCVNVMRSEALGSQHLVLPVAAAQTYADILATAFTPRNCFDALSMQAIHDDAELNALLSSSLAITPEQQARFQSRLREVYETDYFQGMREAVTAPREDLLNDLPARVPSDALQKARERYLPLHAAYKKGK